MCIHLLRYVMFCCLAALLWGNPWLLTSGLAQSAPPEAAKLNVCASGTAPPLNLGRMSSMEFTASTLVREFDIGFSCPSQTVTVSYQESALQLARLDSTIAYTLYADAARTQPLGPGKTPSFDRLPGAAKLYFASTLGVAPTAGVHTQQLTLQLSWRECASWVIFICTGFRTEIRTLLVQISLEILPTCEFASVDPVIDFGTQALISQFAETRTNVGVNCTRKQPYRLYVTDGDHYSDGWRRMQGPGKVYIEYQLYHPSNQQVLNVANPVTGVGTAAVQNTTIVAKVNPSQGNAPVGSYIDRPVVVVEY